MDFKVFSFSSHFSGTLLPDEAPGENTSSINVSSHIFEGLCIRFVIVIQYEKSILYTYDTFTEFSLFQKSCSPGFIFKFSVSGKYIFQFFLPSYFSDWHLINISLPVFPFRSFTVQQLSDFLLSYRTVQFFFTVIHVSGLSCRKSDSYHCLILMDVILLSQWTHPGLSTYFILFM